jgi:hypothetical protein
MKVREAKATNQLEMLESNNILTVGRALAWPQENKKEVSAQPAAKREFSETNPTDANSNRPKYRVLGQPDNFNTVVF